jgi:hypothetical protein
MIHGLRLKLVLGAAILCFSGSICAADDSGGGGRPPHPQLTDAQKTCLSNQGISPPGQGQRPSQAALQAAFQACGIRPPQGGPPPGGQPSGQQGQDDSGGSGSAAD